MNKFALLTIFIVLSFSSPLFAQSNKHTEREAIIAPVETLFNSMRMQDTTLLKSVFIENPYLATISGSDSKLSYRDSATLNDFANSIGSHTGKKLDERIHTDHIQTQSDGMMATAWVPYQFYVGDTFSHCGVNIFVMMKEKESDSWKITSITDTRKTEGCHIE